LLAVSKQFHWDLDGMPCGIWDVPFLLLFGFISGGIFGTDTDFLGNPSSG
jgi:hypothetical protein